MRCLYCGKELALLKRLTGGGEFCSDAHKQSYQEEYNRLALSRLLQAQKKPDKPEKAEKPEKSSKSNKEQAVTPPTPQPPAVELPGVEAAAPPIPEPPSPHAAPEPVVETAPPQPAAHPLEELESFGFLLEFPAVPAAEDGVELTGATPQAALSLEPLAEPSSPPALVTCAVEAPVYDLYTAALAPLAAATSWASPPEATLREAALAPHEFAAARPIPSTRPNLENHRLFPKAGVTTLDVVPRTLKFDPDSGFSQPLSFGTVIQVAAWPNWELPVPSADFPAEDADVVLGPWSGNGDHELWTEMVESAVAAPDELSAEPEATPRMALEALSRLHENLVQAEAREAGTAESATATLVAERPEVEPEVAVPEVPEAAAREQEAAEAPQASPVAVAEVKTAVVEAPVAGPGQVTELLEIALKTFGPAKPGPMSGEPLRTQTAALLPQWKMLPLRAKIAVASGYAPEARRSGPETSQAQKSEAEPKPVAPAPRAPQIQPKPLGSKPVPVPLKAAQTKAIPTPRSKGAVAVAEALKPEAAAKPEIPAPPSKTDERRAAAAPSAMAVEAAPAKPEVSLKENQKEEAGSKPTPAAAAPPEPKADATPRTPLADDLLPSFGTVQPSPSFLGSLKLKLGIGIVIIAGACTAYLGWGNKPHNPAPVSDGAGPSIIMGQGGWVEGWGGDPSGLHDGRQITIYRPSLTLSDYRIEFQGMIETKSLGWVFRAADPENYYAMKLTQVSSGLTPKMALFKYLVVNGRQTQAGRVPIDIPVQPDSYFNVRVDVRGPRFTTYLDGQQVDVWTDDQLKTGGVGLLNEREERGQVKSVSIRILNEAGK